jgi:hypothetical protein
MSKRPSLHSYRHHKQCGQAIVILTDAFGSRRDVLLGTYDSASKKEYDRVIAEWIGNGRRMRVTEAAELSVNELALVYWKHVKADHGLQKCRGDYHNIHAELRILKALYGPTQARHFGPIALKACRVKMLEQDWGRSYINRQVARLVQIFKWAAAEEMLPASVHDQLTRLEGLRKGKTPVKEFRARGQRAAACHSHAKVVSLTIANGERLSIEGSANLCGNGCVREKFARRTSWSGSAVRPTGGTPWCWRPSWRLARCRPPAQPSSGRGSATPPPLGSVGSVAV